ncbi:MAG: DUF5320 domain-containing protein [Methanomicrobiales archaeon]|nr:DUF5320 domain-containing protein [Methanomicrobiales archaeon]MDI6875923.1 DUF5320 domain-containing protein [Methanomicrobiales archaeon]
MPGFDRTGPLGRGPRTGRGMGYCRPGLVDVETAYPRGAYVRPLYGLGRGGLPRGCGRGFGGGRRRFW